MEDLTLWILIGSAAAALGGFAIQKLGRRSKPQPEIKSEVSVETKAEPSPPPADQKLVEPKRPSFSKAISSWVPLLREKSKDRSRWEEALILSDMGPQLTESLLKGLEQTDQDPKEYFKSSLKQVLKPAKSNSEPWKNHKPWVLLVVGVNGVGKTTTIVKLGRYFKELTMKVGVVGADTFRKAAIEQLERGCERNQIDFFSYKTSAESSEGADPSAVLFDGIKKFADQDLILVDTSGRLHTKKNLMDELQKMKRVANKALDGAPHDIWIVLDATLGQNALQQAKVFNESVGLSGIILTKLDGLSRGGSVFELYRQLQVPIWFLGLGEAADDLEAFDPENFVEELFDDRAPKSIG